MIAGTVLLSSVLGCAGPSVHPSAEWPPENMPVRRAWVTPLSQRLQQTIWHARLLMPDKLVSDIVLRDGRLLSVEGQYVDQGFARRLRFIERDVETGRVVREVPLGFDVPDEPATCRLLEFAGTWHIAHPPWSTSRQHHGILMRWPAPGGLSAGEDIVTAGTLPEEFARAIRDASGFASDGPRLLVAEVPMLMAKNDTRPRVAVAAYRVDTGELDWLGQVVIPFRIERLRTRVRVGRFGPVVLARAAARLPHGRRRQREFFAAFEPESGRPLWARSAPPRRVPPSFRLVADARHVYVHVDDTRVEAWRLTDGRPVWRVDLGRPIVADGLLHRGELLTFVADRYPSPRGPSMAEPVRILLDGRAEPQALGGSFQAVALPSFALLGEWILHAPDDMLYAWPRSGGERLDWRCWQLPGGLLAQDAIHEMYPLGHAMVAAYMPGTGALTLLALGSP